MTGGFGTTTAICSRRARLVTENSVHAPAQEEANTAAEKNSELRACQFRKDGVPDSHGSGADYWFLRGNRRGCAVTTGVHRVSRDVTMFCAMELERPPSHDCCTCNAMAGTCKLGKATGGGETTGQRERSSFLFERQPCMTPHQCWRGKARGLMQQKRDGSLLLPRGRARKHEGCPSDEAPRVLRWALLLPSRVGTSAVGGLRIAFCAPCGESSTQTVDQNSETACTMVPAWPSATTTATVAAVSPATCLRGSGENCTASTNGSNMTKDRLLLP